MCHATRETGQQFSRARGTMETATGGITQFTVVLINLGA